MDHPKKLSTVFTVGTIITYGALAFVGMLEFSRLLLLCGTAFVFSGFIEGQVYWEKIAESLKSFFDKNYLQRAILRKKLQQYINAPDFADNIFLAEYRRLCEHVLELYESGHDLTDEQHHELEALNWRIQAKEDFLLKWIEKSKQQQKPVTQSLMETAALEFIIATHHEFDDIETLAMQKKNWLYVGGALASGAGVGSYFATLGAFKIGLALLNIALVGIPGGIVFAVLLFGAVGYALSLYQSILEVVKKYTFSELINEITQFFEKASWAKRFAMFLVVAFTIFATIATAGTWLKLIKNGALLVPIIESVTAVIQIVSIVVMVIPTIIYSLVNSCESFNSIAKKLTEETWHEIKQGCIDFFSKVKQTWEKENVMQFINPFRIITEILEGLIFLTHLASIAVGNDQFPEKISSTVACVLVEAAVDAPALFHEHHDYHDALIAPKQLQLDKLDDKHHNHSHGFSNILLFIPRCAGIFWDFSLSTVWFYVVSMPCQRLFATKKMAAPNWQETKEKFFGKHSHNQTQPFKSSNAWIAQELMEKCEQHTESYDIIAATGLLAEKFHAIATLKEELAASQEHAAADQPLSTIVAQCVDRNKDSFSAHRSSFFNPFTPTKTTQFMEDLLQQSQAFGG